MLASLVFLVAASPPRVEISPNGTTLTQGGLVVRILPDGSITIKSPTVDLTIPGAGNDIPLPPAPIKDPLADAIGGIYGGLQEPTKAKNAAALAKAYKGIEWEDGMTIGAIAGQLKGIVPAGQFVPIRERIGREVAATLGSDPTAVLSDSKRVEAEALFVRLANILAGLK